MTETTFDPRGFLQFDLKAGKVRAGQKRRHLIIPTEVMEAAASPGGFEAAARRWGEEQGRELAKGPAKAALLGGQPEGFVTQVRGLLATLGWGRIELQSWGGVLFAEMHGAPGGAGTSVLASFLAGLFSAVSESSFDCVPMDQGARFLLTAADGAERIRQWVEGGASTGDVVTRMLAGEHLSAQAGGH